MKLIFYFLFALFFPILLRADQELVVHLTSSAPYYKTYIEGPQEVQAILAYDVEHNGFCALTRDKKEAAILIESKLSSNKELMITVKQLASQRTLQLQPLLMSGEIAKDRHKIHAASDLICKELFGIPGIASHRILYTSRKKESSDSTQWTAEVWLADYDGANATPITKERALCVTPTFLPRRVGDNQPPFFYVSYREGEPKIFLGRGQESKRLTYMAGNQFMPAISRQLDRIAFISTIHGREDLFLQAFSLENGVIGKARKLFSAPLATQGSPTFSPDGKKIAFVSNKDGTARIYWMKIPRQEESPQECPLHVISKKNRDNTAPHWSPDGKKIAYSAMTNGVRQIWIYDVQKEQESQLTFDGEHKENPVWGANNLHIMYNTASYEKAELYMIDTNHKRPIKIALGPKDKRFPTWEG